MNNRRGFYYTMTQRTAPALEWRCPKCTARVPVDMTSSARGWRTGDCRIAVCGTCGKLAAQVVFLPIAAVLQG